MKLCFINPTKQPRTVVYGLANHLVDKGYIVSIIHPCTNKNNIPTSDNIDIIPLPSLFLPKINYTLPSFYKQYNILSSLIKKNKYDIVQACAYVYLTSIAPIFIKNKFKIPIILTIDAFPGLSWEYGNVFIDSIAKLYTYSLGKFILNSYDKLIFLYNNLSKEAIDFGIPIEKIHIIPNGIYFKQFNLKNNNDLKYQLGIKDDEKVLLFVGRLALVKRVDILIEITKRLLKKGFHIKTIIVGEGPYRMKYEKLAESVKDKVIFVGAVPHDNIYEYFAIADVFVLPSLSEGLPTVLLEAGANSKPSVASKVGGIPDIIIHGRTGFLANPKDVDSFVHYVKLLLSDEELSKNMGQNAYKHVRENFAWESIIKKYEEYSDGNGVHINTVEAEFSVLRPWLATFRGVSKERLYLYTSHYEFLRNHRDIDKVDRMSRMIQILQPPWLSRVNTTLP